MPTRDIIVVGASAGGIEALQQLVQTLPAHLPAAMLIVQHTRPSHRSYLPEILARQTELPVTHPVDSEPIIPGRIYIAPPDHHLLIEDEHIRVTKGPKENHCRPAVDPLFRSAAYFHGSRVIGVVLSGMLGDGTAGLWNIKDRGGLAVVQDPTDALYPAMPRAL
jgi:two-component system chemotaxis response regulator CheB